MKITFAIQSKYKNEDWEWSLFFDKPFDTKEEAIKALKKLRKSKDSTYLHRCVIITPLDI